MIGNLLEIIAHDRAGRRSASDDPEPGAREGGGISAAGSARRYVGVERIGFEHRSICAPCDFQCFRNQLECYAPPAVSFSHVEAGQGPDRRIIHTLELPQPIEPGQGISRCHLTPSDSRIAVESKYAWRRTMLDVLPERGLVFLAGSLSVRTTDPSVHTPTATADGAVTEQVLERRPQIRASVGESQVPCQPSSATYLAQSSLSYVLVHHRLRSMRGMFENGVSLSAPSQRRKPSTACMNSTGYSTFDK